VLTLGFHQMNKFRLDGKVAFVTGGSSGIGAAASRALAAEGAKVIVGFYQGAERARVLVDALVGSGHDALAIDLSSFESHSRLPERIGALGGRLDFLVNSAGFTQRIPHKDLSSLTPEIFGQMLSANVVGTFSITRALLPMLIESGAGVVVNVSSVSAFTGAGSNIAYCAAKAALDTMTVSLARVFGPQVRFLCVSPASVDTDFVAGRSKEELQKKAAITPLGRVVTSEDVADAVLACVTHLHTATGTRIVIDGGHTL